MKTHSTLALITLTMLTAVSAHAAPKINLALDESGNVTIEREGTVIGKVINRMMDTSPGYWRGLSSPVEPQEGSKLEWTADFTFPDGSVVERKTVMEVKDSQLTIESSWPTDSSAQGFGMIVLNIPQETAADLTVEAEGNVIFKDFDRIANPTAAGGLVFRQTSTGDFLFEAKSSDPNYSLSFVPSELYRGLEFRIGGRKPLEQSISVDTSVSAIFSFEE